MGGFCAYIGLHFGKKKTSKIWMFIEELSRDSVFFGTEVALVFEGI